MGQYYEIITKDTKDNIKHYNRYVGAQYTGAKLIEHSWIGNNFVDTLSKKLYKKSHRVAWVGDYADDQEPINDLDEEEIKELHTLVWGDEHGDDVALPESHVRLNKLDYTGLFLVNHTKHVYINMDEYIELNKDSDGDTLHPLPLLTALGNGKGGGDYIGTNQQEIGSWVWDIVEFNDKAPVDYQETSFVFLSDYQHPRQEVKERIDEIAANHTGEHNGQYIVARCFNYETREEYCKTVEWRGTEAPKLYQGAYTIINGKVWNGMVWAIVENPEKVEENVAAYHINDYSAWVEEATWEIYREAQKNKGQGEEMEMY